MGFYKKKPGDWIFMIVSTTVMIFLALITLYPFLYVLFASLSDPQRFLTFKGILLKPVGFTLESYKAVINNPNILIGYKNTLFLVVVGTLMNVFFNSVGAYFLSRKGPIWRTPIVMMIVLTMFVSGGMIPTYLLIKKLHMFNTLWSLIVPGCMGTFNMIIIRTAFQAVPKGLEESAKIDGATDWVILFRIILPLSIPTIAVIGLFSAVSQWNSWFTANIYLQNKNLFPLQLILRNIVINSETSDMTIGSAMGNSYAMSFTIKYATVMVATLPILVVYPFVQKYFVKGVMIGSLKE